MRRTYNRRQVKDFVAREKEAQKTMDRYYTLWDNVKVDRMKASKDFDAIITKGNQKWKAEEKFRFVDYGDILIELFQAVEMPELGWFYHTKCDYLIYAICDNDIPSYLYSLPWHRFKPWFYSYLKNNKFPKAIISPKGIGISLNIAIPVLDIPENTIRRFDIKGILEVYGGD